MLLIASSLRVLRVATLTLTFPYGKGNGVLNGPDAAAGYAVYNTLSIFVFYISFHFGEAIIR